MKPARSVASVLLVAALTVTLPKSASCQGLWTELSTVGYGGMGVGVGVLLTDPLFAFDAKILGGAAIGLLVGFTIGHDAEAMARDGREISGVGMWLVRVGSVTGGAALGAGMTGILVATSGGNEEGQDERVIAAGSVVGALMGLWYQYGAEQRLAQGAPGAAELLLQPGTHGSLNLGVRIPTPDPGR